MISSTSVFQQYTGDGSTQVFTVPFQFFYPSDLLVYLTDNTNPLAPVTTLQTFDSAYVVTGGAGVGGYSPTTGTVAFVTAPAAALVVTILLNSVTTQQILDAVDNDPFPAASLEAAMDKLALLVQQALFIVGRSLSAPVVDATALASLPSIAARASAFLAFDSSGNPMASAGVVPGSIPVSTFIQTLLDDVDAAAARATLLIPTCTETWSNKSFVDNVTWILSHSDATKRVAFDCTALTTGTTRTWAFQDASDTVVGRATTDTLTNKTVDFGSNGNAMKSTAATAAGQVLTSDGSSGTSWLGIFHRNLAVNGDFGLWQRYGSSPSQTLANTVQQYVADMFYGFNSLGTTGVITISQVAAVTPGSAFGCKVQITTAPTAAKVNGCELFYVLENADTLRIYNGVASFSAQIKALTNVTQVGISFVYETSEAKPGTSAASPTTKQIGSEVLVAVNSATFTLGAINGQAMGTAMTTAGVIGVRIRITAVSTGNPYDISNGFVVEQFGIYKSSYAPGFSRAGATFAAELAMAMRYYEKSAPQGLAPSSAGYDASEMVFYPASTIPTAGVIDVKKFKVPKRTSSPTAAMWSLGGTSNRIGNYRTSSDVTGAIAITAQAMTLAITNNSGGGITTLTTTDGLAYSWAVDAAI